MLQDIDGVAHQTRGEAVLAPPPGPHCTIKSGVLLPPLLVSLLRRRELDIKPGAFLFSCFPLFFWAKSESFCRETKSEETDWKSQDQLFEWRVVELTQRCRSFYLSVVTTRRQRMYRVYVRCAPGSSVDDLVEQLSAWLPCQWQWVQHPYQMNPDASSTGGVELCWTESTESGVDLTGSEAWAVINKYLVCKGYRGTLTGLGGVSYEVPPRVHWKQRWTSVANEAVRKKEEIFDEVALE